MSILGKIMGAIFGNRAQAAPAEQTASAGATPAGPGTAQAGETAGSSTPAAGGAAGSSGGNVDVAEVLDKAVKDSGQKLNWKTSIVDLMKALDLDSSLTARKELAKELKYTGDTNDSATMNIWLHKQVIQKLKDNGGKVPADLKD